MKRDMDLMRDILQWLEENNYGQPQIPEKDAQEIGYHCHLLAQSGLIEAVKSTTSDDDLPQALPTSLTNLGHDFLDSSRSSGVWTTVKQRVATTTGAVSLALLTELLKEEAKRRFGLTGS